MKAKTKTTKGKTKANGKPSVTDNEIRQALQELDPRDLPAVRAFVETKKAKVSAKAEKNWNKLERAAFPAEFLDSISETAFYTAIAHLKKTKASKDVIDLLDIFYCLMMEYARVVEMKGKTESFNNTATLEYVANASRLIVAMGGTFYTENGSVTPMSQRPHAKHNAK